MAFEMFLGVFLADGPLPNSGSSAYCMDVEGKLRHHQEKDQITYDI
jgi:hypothetical protein